MKKGKLEHAALAKNLGSVVRGNTTASAGYFGALQVAEEVRRRLRRPKRRRPSTRPALDGARS